MNNPQLRTAKRKQELKKKKGWQKLESGLA